MRPSQFARRFLPVLLLGVTACSDDPVVPTGPFDLTFTGDASFQGAHGGQEIQVIVTASDGEVLASESAVVSETDDPSFTFVFADLLEQGQSYDLRYWIDSNFGGGSAGVCDPPGTDHQWLVAISAVSDDVEIADTHRPGETSSVCDTFTFDLAFSGDASFQGAHGGQALQVAVVDEEIGAVVATDATTVSGSDDPAFSFDFPGLLIRERSYHLDYWIDSNFGGGTAGICDPPANDHQWRIELGPVTESATVPDTHRPSETQSVCSTFD